MNSGHICTAPDHVLVWSDVKDAFVRHLGDTIREFYGDEPKSSPDYGRVINARNFDRLVRLMGSGKAVIGGQSDAAERYIAPTVLVDVSPESPIMQEEVFGPILPVLEIGSVEAVIQWVDSRPAPLGLYVFAEDSSVAERILEATSSGDAAINDCAIHPLIPELPFGGVSNSDGQISWQVGFQRVHQRARRPLSQRKRRPRCTLPSVFEAHVRAQNRKQTDALAEGIPDGNLGRLPSPSERRKWTSTCNALANAVRVRNQFPHYLCRLLRRR